MNIEKKFSGYIGFSPISLFITLEDIDYGLHGLREWLDDIISFNVEDIIFQGAIIRNLDFLQWLFTRMIAEKYYISLVLDCGELQKLKETRIYAHRITLMINKLPLKLAEILERLGKNDIIIVDTDNILTLKKVETTMIGIGCEATLYFNSEALDKSKVLKAGIAVAYPFGGLNASKESTDEIGTANRAGVYKEKS